MIFRDWIWWKILLYSGFANRTNIWQIRIFAVFVRKHTNFGKNAWGDKHTRPRPTSRLQERGLHVSLAWSNTHLMARLDYLVEAYPRIRHPSRSRIEKFMVAQSAFFAWYRAFSPSSWAWACWFFLQLSCKQLAERSHLREFCTRREWTKVSYGSICFLASELSVIQPCRLYLRSI